MPSLRGSVTQGGADAFAIATIQTGLEGQTRLAYQVTRIMFEVPRMATSGAGNIELCLSRRTKAAMPNITDVDVIQKLKMGGEFTTSGQSFYPLTHEFKPESLLIVEGEIFFCVDSNATSLTQTVYFVVEYDVVQISETDRLSLLVQSLS